MEVSLIRKAFPEQDKCIFLCTDNGFAPVAAVAIQSIIETADINEKYDILLFHSGIMPFHKTTIEGLANGHDNISVRVVDSSYLTKAGSFYVENRKTITQETYFRLFVPFILEASYKRAVYIDCDMVVLNNIHAIFNYDISQHLIGAVRDFWGTCHCYMPNDPRRAYREGIGLDNIDDYIIGATILFNLEKYREKFSYEQVLDLVYAHKWQQHDQDVINVMCKDSILHISPAWGMMPMWNNDDHFLPPKLLEEFQSVSDYSIFHYAANKKPWIKHYEKGRDYFWVVASKTPYFSHLVSLIDDSEYKCYVLKKICNGEFDLSYGTDNVIFKTHGVDAGNLNSGYTQYRSISISGDILHLEGAIASFLMSPTDALNAKLILNGSIRDVDCQFASNFKAAKLAEEIYRLQSFKTDVKLIKGDSYRLKMIGETDGLTINPESTLFGKFCALGKEYQNSYYYCSGWLVTYEPSGEILVRKSGKLEVFKRELSLFRELFNKRKRKAAITRGMATIIKLFLKKNIWLVSDRISKADDNGEVFFSFLQEHKDEVHSYFILDKTACDYPRLKKIGKVIQPYSMKHKLLTLLADCTISSQTDMVFRNPFNHDWKPYRNMLWNTRFIFLQHGVSVADLTNWLKRSKQYIAGFVTTTRKEYRMFKEGGYGYDEELWLTGMPRYDRLKSNPGKIITIAPTWRMYLATKQNHDTGIWETVPDFSSSSYVCFYRDLLADQRLIEASNKYGYTIQFKLHPSFYGQESLFGFSNNVKIVPNHVTYQEIFSQSDLMVTDYSSLIHDFVYLYKPVIYCQFDREEFNSGHIYDPTSVNYEVDGYGEVEYTLDGTVSRIIEYMENNCQLKEKYKKRIDDAFQYHDHNNCERIYKKIMELSK